MHQITFITGVISGLVGCCYYCRDDLRYVSFLQLFNAGSLDLNTACSWPGHCSHQF